jgi:alcohol dehydrogenase class IV
MRIEGVATDAGSALERALHGRPLRRPFVGPSRVLATPGASDGLGAELRAVGAEPAAGRVAVVVDAAVLELGLHAPAVASLKGELIDVAVLAPISAEPTPEIVESLLAELAGADVSAVVGIGGGSAMDTAKLVAAGIGNELPLRTGIGPDARLVPAVPIALVPTTAGTGAEATAVAMLWHEGVKRIFVHPLLVPRVAILDGSLLTQLPPAVIAASGLDAVSHAVESMLSTFRTPLSVVHAAAALEALGTWLPIAYAEPTEEALAAVLFGSFQAGLALNASVVLGHSVAYTIASRTGLSHGVTCAMALPYCLAYCRGTSDAAMTQAARLVGAGSRPDDLFDWLLRLNESMAIPASLAAVGIPSSAIAAMAAECVETYPRPNNPARIAVEPLERLLAAFHAGQPARAWEETVALDG